LHTTASVFRFGLIFWHKFELSASFLRDMFQNPQAGQFGCAQFVEGAISQLARFDGGEMAGTHPDAFGECLLGDAISLQFLDQSIQGDAFEVIVKFWQTLRCFKLLGFDLFEGVRVIQEGHTQGDGVVTASV